jgi:hypothetical protein
MGKREQKIGAAAGVSAAAAFGSFLLTCTGNPVWGLVAGLLALPSGVLGFLMAASPRRRGGIISLMSIVVGVLAVLVAGLALLGFAIGGTLGLLMYY